MQAHTGMQAMFPLPCPDIVVVALQVQGFLYSKDLVTSLFAEVPDRYADRSSGFTRIIQEPRVRRGDSATMCVIEMV